MRVVVLQVSSSKFEFSKPSLSLPTPESPSYISISAGGLESRLGLKTDLESPVISRTRSLT